MKQAILLFILFFPFYLGAQNSPVPEFPLKAENEDGVLPETYVFLSKASADFNKDGIQDFIFIAEKEGLRESAFEDPDTVPPRILGIYFGIKKAGGAAALQRHLIHHEAVYGPHEGGVFGDPFNSLSVKGNSFILSFYGGSSWRWGTSWQFRFQNGGFYLIGHTKYSHRTVSEEAEKEDYNLSTGMMIRETTDESGRMVSKKINRGRKKLLNLKEFSIYNDGNQF